MHPGRLRWGGIRERGYMATPGRDFRTQPALEFIARIEAIRNSLVFGSTMMALTSPMFPGLAPCNPWPSASPPYQR
jgi:hypothetical protein